MKTYIAIIVAILVVGGGIYFYMLAPVGSDSLPNAVVGEGGHCGGNIASAPICGAGLRCVPTPGSNLPFGDVGGTCVPD